jgi:hypothetical protein
MAIVTICRSGPRKQIKFVIKIIRKIPDIFANGGFMIKGNVCYLHFDTIKILKLH